MNLFAGWRTYAVAVAMGLAALLYGLGLIERNTFEALMGLFNGLGFAALRKGVRDETVALPKGEPPVTP